MFNWLSKSMITLAIYVFLTNPSYSEYVLIGKVDEKVTVTDSKENPTTWSLDTRFNWATHLAGYEKFVYIPSRQVFRRDLYVTNNYRYKGFHVCYKVIYGNARGDEIHYSYQFGINPRAGRHVGNRHFSEEYPMPPAMARSISTRRMEWAYCSKDQAERFLKATVRFFKEQWADPPKSPNAATPTLPNTNQPSPQQNFIAAAEMQCIWKTSPQDTNPGNGRVTFQRASANSCEDARQQIQADVNSSPNVCLPLGGNHWQPVPPLKWVPTGSCP